MKGFLTALLLFIAVQLRAQFTYQFDQSIPVEVDGKLLSMPWAGGLNSAQINTMDLNGDSQNDLVVFDRTANRVLTYLRKEQKYQYTPDYESLFPTQVNQWMLLRDFNCDGRKDLFTSDPFGIQVFVNITKPGESLKWRTYNPGFPLLTKGFSSNINLKVNETDIPAIDDIDGDGDLDVLNVKFVGIGSIEWHKNLSMERTGRCDSMQLERITQNYGGVEECSCGKFAFGQTCESLGGGRTQHAGGKTLLTLDLDNDGDRELLFSEETCSRVFVLMNEGTKDAAVFKQAQNFPGSLPINFLIFPSPYLEDLDFDNVPDLVASPNVYARTFTNINFMKSVWLYKNSGTLANPSFSFQQDNFLQSEMIDLGDYTVPTFADADGDGDLDMFVGIYAAQNFRSSIYFYENIGTESEAFFKFVSDDYASTRLGGNYNIKPQMVDMNGDGKIDLAFTATDLQRGTTTLQYLPNNADDGLRVSYAQVVSSGFTIGQSENLTVADVNRDGLPDVLVGTATGALHYWENAGPKGEFNLIQKSDAFLGLAQSSSRQNPAPMVADLDADGQEDLLLADQRGVLSIYSNFRNFDPAVFKPTTDMIFNSLTETYSQKDLGLRVRPAVANIFNSDKPAIVVGSVLGGIYILKNEDSQELPPVPVVTISPNPVERGADLTIKGDRDLQLQIFSIVGQKMCEPIFIPAHQSYPLTIHALASGIYIARIQVKGKTFAQKFVVR